MTQSIYQPHDVIRTDQPDGSVILRARAPLAPVVDRATDWLDHWAAATPDAVFLAERSGAGWREETYSAIRDQARALAAGLLELDLGPDRPILIISGNSVDHGILALAAQYVGVPIVPVAEQYALIMPARAQLDYVAGLVKPGLIYAEDGTALREVLARPSFDGARKLVSHGATGDMLTLRDLMRTDGDIAEAAAAVGPETIAKILMTSGSTSSPKGVLTTHRMMCTNQTQIAQALPFLRTRPPRIVDWLPWNHVFGGTHNFNMMLAHGGALYIDSGKPVPALVGRSIENLRLKTGTLAFNVPVGFSMLRDEMKRDAALRQSYFEEMDMLFYAGASLPQDVWADLEAMAREVRGDMPLFNSSWGLTETAPAAIMQHEPTDRSGIVGVPLPGLQIKMIPDEDARYEIRVKGPSVFTAYFNDPEKTADAFDADGFFKTGDAMKLVDPANLNMGLRFDGRISEDFKLLTGTWVRAANLRLDVLAALGADASDVIITGADRSDIGVMIIPTAALRQDAVLEDDGALLAGPATSRIIDALGAFGTGSSTRIARAMILSEPPQIAEGEITAKGNLNFRKLMQRRANLLDRLYHDADPATLMIAQPVTYSGRGACEMKLSVIGAGAIGGWLTTGFIDAGATATVLARGETLAALRAGGLKLNDGASVTTFDVAATDDPTDLQGADVLLLGIKAHDLPNLAPIIAQAVSANTTILPAINGLPWWFFENFGGPAQGIRLESTDPGGVLSRVMPADRVVGAVIHAGSYVETPGTIRLMAANRVILGDAAKAGKAAEIAAFLSGSSIPAIASDAIHQEVWSKRWGNSNMNPLSALSRADLSQMLDDPGVRGLATAMMQEMSALGTKIGLTGFDDIAERMQTTRKLGAFRTSMLQDLEAGRALELDPILGALVELAARLDVPTPFMDGVHGLTRLLDRNLRDTTDQA